MSSSLTLCTTSLILIPLLLSLEYSWGINSTLPEYLDGNKRVTPVVVDLANLKSDKDYHCHSSNFGIAARTIIVPMPGHKITGVHFNGIPLHKYNASKRNVVEYLETCWTDEDAMVTLSIEGLHFKFGKVGDQFVPLTTKEFLYRLERMWSPYTLDVSQTESSDEVSVSKTPLFDTMVYDIRSSYGTRVEKLTDDRITIWADKGGSEFIKSTRVSHGSAGKLIAISVETSQDTKTIHFVGNGSGYFTISPQDYYKHLAGGNAALGELLQQRSTEVS
ncbi:hypothetical protein BgAZ_202050 [Babesia gibsoni]|uniref:Uncharacterized protein n=1 Tax=Babesia gibsoni TaxID=33632 RepID=A0AAD8PDU7_BABGI|nr:hypothetical protein BgAZ_202050 [Babesia gibsoni]